MEQALKILADYWPHILIGLTAFVGAAAWFNKFTRETPWKWDDPIGSAVGKAGVAVSKALDLAKKIVGALLAK